MSEYCFLHLDAGTTQVIVPHTSQVNIGQVNLEAIIGNVTVVFRREPGVGQVQLTDVTDLLTDNFIRKPLVWAKLGCDCCL